MSYRARRQGTCAPALESFTLTPAHNLIHTRYSCEHNEDGDDEGQLAAAAFGLRTFRMVGIISVGAAAEVNAVSGVGRLLLDDDDDDDDDGRAPGWQGAQRPRAGVGGGGVGLRCERGWDSVRNLDSPSHS